MLKDESNRVYEIDKENANGFHRVFALNCKPVEATWPGYPWQELTERRQRKQHKEQKKRTHQRRTADVPTAVPPVSRVELTAALRLLHGNEAAGTDRVTNEKLLNLSNFFLDFTN